MQKTHLLLLLGLCAIGNLFAAQPKEKAYSPSQAKKDYEAARYDNLYKGLQSLDPAHLSDKNRWLLAETAFLLRKYPEAAALYPMLPAKNYPQGEFNLALIHKMLGDPNRAIAELDSFGTAKLKKDYLYLKPFARREKLGAQMWLSDSIQKADIQIHPLGSGVNTLFPESWPRYKGEHSLYFCSVLTGKITGRIPAQLYVSNYESTEWMRGNIVNGEFNNLPFEIGSSCLSPDGSTLYFTVSVATQCGEHHSQIYSAQQENGSWNHPKALGLGINPDDGSSNQDPQLIRTADGQLLMYFSSNRTGGKGGYDIYSARLNSSGDFDQVTNLGKVNSARDDISPWMDASKNRLYFSSNGHPGLGGFDVFYSYNDPMEGYQEPVNMCRPVNSGLDDIGFSTSADGNKAVLASNRSDLPDGADLFRRNSQITDYNNFDIYEVILKKPTWYIEPIVFEESDGNRQMSSHTQIDVYHNNQLVTSAFPDGSNRLLIELPETGAYSLKARQSGFYEGNFNLLIDENSPDSLPLTMVIQKIPPVAPPPPAPVSLAGTRLGTVHFEYNQFHLTADAPDTLKRVEQFLKEHPDYIVEIGGHADDKGADDYNMKLSLKRAEAVKRYFDVNMKDSTRTVAKGYGETKPIAPNQKPDGSDNPDGRAMNRRVEFVVREKATKAKLLDL